MVDGKHKLSLKLQQEQHCHHKHGRGKHAVNTYLGLMLTVTIMTNAEGEEKAFVCQSAERAGERGFLAFGFYKESVRLTSVFFKTAVSYPNLFMEMPPCVC